MSVGTFTSSWVALPPGKGWTLSAKSGIWKFTSTSCDCWLMPRNDDVGLPVSWRTMLPSDCVTSWVPIICAAAGGVEDGGVIVVVKWFTWPGSIWMFIVVVVGRP